MEKQSTTMQKKKSLSRMLSKKDWDIQILTLWLLISAISWKVTQSCPGLKNLSPQKKIDAVVRNLPNDKAPGPDGFNNEFIKRC